MQVDERGGVLGVVCALSREAPSRMGGVVVAVGGPGRANAARAAEKLAVENRLSGLLSFGFAGALSPDLRPGDIVIDTAVPEWRMVAEACVARWADRCQVRGDPTLCRPGTAPSREAQTDDGYPSSGRLASVAALSEGRGPAGRVGSPEGVVCALGYRRRRSIHLGRIVTVDRVILAAAERAKLACETGAIAVDMESDAIAAVAASRSLPFAAIRAITDTARRDMVIDWNRCRRADGTFRPLAAIRQALTSLQAMAEILQLWYASRLASWQLNLFLGELLSVNGTIKE